MYTIFADGVKIFDDQYVVDDLMLISPKLTLSDNAAGTLTFTMPTTNAGYSIIKRLTTSIVVMKHDSIVWAGRVLEEEVNWHNQRKVTCEGDLAYLCDSIQPPNEFHNYTIKEWLGYLLLVHNLQVEESKRFELGDISVSEDVNDNLYRYTNYESTIDAINDKLLSRLGGHLRVRHVGDKRYLDYFSDYPRTSRQEINFGDNLLSFTKKFDMSELCSIIIPRGEALEESPFEALTAYLTVESVNNGSIFVVNDELVATYGQIVKVVDWEDVTKPENLLKKAQTYLSDTQFETMELELDAVDLASMLGPDYDIRLLDLVKCVSKPHGMDRYFPVTKITIDLTNSGDTEFTLGDTVRSSYTSATESKVSQVVNHISEVQKSNNLKIQEVKDTKQDILTPGNNITISSDGVISSTAGITYLPGSNIQINRIDDRTSRISATDTKYNDGRYISIDDNGRINFIGRNTELIELTGSEYAALPESEKMNPNKVYFIPDGDLDFIIAGSDGADLIGSDGNIIIGRI